MVEEKKNKSPKEKIQCDYRVKCYEDGKYHWKYDFNMLKNPTVLIDLFKALGLSVAIVACFLFIIQTCENGVHPEQMEFVLNLTGILVVVMLVLGILGYLIYAAMSGWVYTVHFTMDENGVIHEQSPSAKKLSNRIGCLAVLVGLLAKRPGTMGAGMLAAGHTSMSSDFSSVKKVIALRKINTIKVNERFTKNRVYVNNDDFDFVYEYISSRCPNAKIK